MAIEDWPLSDDDGESERSRARALSAEGLRRVEAAGDPGFQDGRYSRLDRARDEQDEDPISQLAAHVRSCLTRATAHRKRFKLDETFETCQRNRDGRYAEADLEQYPPGCDVFRNVTGMLCRAAESWILDVYAEAMDRPWTLEPTPVPSLPEHLHLQLEQAIQQAVIAQMQADPMGMMAAPPKEIIDRFRNTAHALAMDEASKASDLMQQRIEDQFDEGGWRAAWRRFISEIVTYPCACLKGPVIERRKRLVWNGNELEPIEEPTLCVESVDPRNLFPAPDATNAQDGEFIIERMRLTRAKLNACRDMPSFSPDALALVLVENTSTPDWNTDDVNVQRQNDVDFNEANGDGVRDMFTVYDFWGRVTGRMFLNWLQEQHAADIAEDHDGVVETKWGLIDPLRDYELNVWLCNNIVLRAILNPHPLNKRPFHVASCYPRVGSFWGQGVPEIVGDTQRELNATVRAKVRNLGFSSGPLVEMDIDRVQDEDKDVEPWRVFMTRSKGEERFPAIQFHQVPSNVQELLAVAAEAWQAAHDLAGIPPYTRGDNRGAAQTLGAFSMQYAGALKGIKQIIGNIDVAAIEPLVEAFWVYNMMFADDPAIKADAQVKARGAQGLIALEHRQARPLETLQAVGPILKDAAPNAMLMLVGEFLKAAGYDPASFGLPGGIAESEMSKRATGAAPQIGAGGVPRVDGRSGPALSAMQQQPLPAAPPSAPPAA